MCTEQLTYVVVFAVRWAAEMREREGARGCEKGSVVEGQWHLFGVQMLAGHSCVCAAALDPPRHWPTRSRGGRGIGQQLHQSRLTTAAKLLEQPLWIAPFHER
jgi:hypothetical protein